MASPCARPSLVRLAPLGVAAPPELLRVGGCPVPDQMQGALVGGEANGASRDLKEDCVDVEEHLVLIPRKAERLVDEGDRQHKRREILSESVGSGVALALLGERALVVSVAFLDVRLEPRLGQVPHQPINPVAPHVSVVGVEAVAEVFEKLLPDDATPRGAMQGDDAVGGACVLY